jgi:DNA-directed RNA polymerase specialized sigma24 family protein
MANHREQQYQQPARGSRSLPRRSGDGAGGCRAWEWTSDPKATGDDDLDETSRRRPADQRLYDHLAQDGFAGPAYEVVAGQLAAYGIGVCEAWLSTGVMFVHCARRGRALPPPPADWSVDDRRELVGETVATALHRFREYALVKGEWTASGGASLTTYFVGCCVLVFPNVYRSWLRERARWSRMELNDYLADRPADAASDPADLAVSNVDLSVMYLSLDQRIAAAIALTADGYTQLEIAEILGISARAVEGLLYRHRRRLQQDTISSDGRRQP